MAPKPWNRTGAAAFGSDIPDNPRMRLANLGTGDDSGSAFRQPDSTTAGLLIRIRAYDAALREFRAAIGLPISKPVTPD